MLSDADKRAAQLAVVRYGADPVRVQQVVNSVLDSHSRGGEEDLYSALVVEKLLSSAQAEELRQGLEKTQIDLTPRKLAPDIKKASNGSSASTDLTRLGDYHILRRLGEGGMGSVYLGYYGTEDQKVAIKVLPKNLAANQGTVDRFYREAKSGALLGHPNIVRNLNVGQDQASGNHYLVLEYVDGPSAQALLDQCGSLSVGDAVHIALDIARGLEHAHSRNVVHRDIKPANILITQSGVAKLADMGLAKRTDETSHLTAARQGFGTPYYMPYEQAMNAKYADGRSDIYALGATLYHMVVGDVPFSGANALEIVDKKGIGEFTPASIRNPAVPAALDQILARMMAREPKQRYQTSSELIVDLERSKLAAAVPSFIDPDKALLDPLVRERLTSPTQPTSLDVNAPQPANGEAAGDFWYIRYRDRHGLLCKAKATTAQLTDRLRSGKLAADSEASRKPQGEFRKLSEFDEFKIVIPTDGDSEGKRRRNAIVASFHRLNPPDWWLVVGVGIGVAILAVVAITLYHALIS